MIKTDAVSAELPTEKKFCVINERGNIEQAEFEILDHATRFENAVERGLEGLGELLVLRSNLGKLAIRHDHAAHHHDAGRHGGKILVETREFLAAIHGLNEQRFKLAAGTLRLGQCKKPRRWLGSVLIGSVVFVCHRESVLRRGSAIPQ